MRQIETTTLRLQNIEFVAGLATSAARRFGAALAASTGLNRTAMAVAAAGARDLAAAIDCAMEREEDAVALRAGEMQMLSTLCWEAIANPDLDDEGQDELYRSGVQREAARVLLAMTDRFPLSMYDERMLGQIARFEYPWERAE